MMCSYDFRCKSLNFRLVDMSCDLNDADRFTHPGDYGPKYGFVYILAYGGCARGTNGGQNCTVLTSSNFIVD